MTESRINIQKHAMHFGTYMGIFWILKFALFPLGFNIPFLSLLFILSTFAVPFVGYYYTKTYRDKFCSGVISFSHAFQFTIFLYLFASMLTAVVHYIYFQYIDGGFVLQSYENLWNQLMTTSPGLIENKEVIKEIIDTARSLTPIDITFQTLSGDFIWGCILAIPTALVVMRKPRN